MANGEGSHGQLTPETYRVPLSWQRESWSLRPAILFIFTCTGRKWGREAWRLDLAQANITLPEAMTEKERKLLRLQLAKGLTMILKAWYGGSRHPARFNASVIAGLEEE